MTTRTISKTEQESLQELVATDPVREFLPKHSNGEIKDPCNLVCKWLAPYLSADITAALACCSCEEHYYTARRYEEVSK